MKTLIKAIGLLVALAVCLASPLYSQVPDLTKDAQSVDRKLTYNLGATGLRGWICTKAASNLDASQGCTTLASRQILVTHVEAPERRLERRIPLPRCRQDHGTHRQSVC